MRSAAWAFLLALAAATPAPDAPLQAQLDQCDAAAAHIKDLSAHFQQKKYTALLKSPMLSSGTVRAAASTVRWDTTSPQLCTLFSDGGELCLYYPDSQQEEIYPVDARWGDLLTSPVPRLAAIRKHFTIQLAAENDLPADLRAAAQFQSALSLRLTPDDPELAKHIRVVLVVLDTAAGLTRAVETTDPDGDRTDMLFSDVRLNTGLSPADLQLHVPGGTTISHPLDQTPTTTAPSAP